MAKANAKSNAKKAARHCPFCDLEIYEMRLPVCTACHTTIVYCKQCREPLPKDRTDCPACGADNRG